MPPSDTRQCLQELDTLVFVPVPCILLHCLTQTLVVLALALTVDAESEYVADLTSEGIGWAIVVLVGGYIIVALVVVIANWTNRTKVRAQGSVATSKNIYIYIMYV